MTRKIKGTRLRCKVQEREHPSHSNILLCMVRSKRVLHEATLTMLAREPKTRDLEKQTKELAKTSYWPGGGRNEIETSPTLYKKCDKKTNMGNAHLL